MIVDILLTAIVGIIIIAWLILSVVNKRYLLTVAIGLLLFGVFAILSVSIFESFQLTLRVSDEPSNYFYFLRQIKHILVSLISWALILLIPLDKVRNNAGKIFLLVFIFQLLIFTSLGQVFNGARWWLYLPGLGSVQPSEFFKLWFVIFLAAWLIRKKKELNSLELFFAIIILSAISFFIFLLIPDLGTLLVVWPVVLILYWYAGWKLIYIMASIVLGLTLWLTVGMQFDYIKQRVEYFVNPDIDESNQGIWWQTKQGLIAIWSGWFLWKWYGKWLQKFGFIPEAQSDFIFAAFSEEVWFVGNTVLLMLYFLLAYISLTRIERVQDEYLRNLAVGIVALISMQAFINIWVNIKIIPLTGLTLPFISYGWTALMVNIWEIALLYNILYSNYTPKKEKSRSFVYTSLRSELP